MAGIHNFNFELPPQAKCLICDKPLSRRIGVESVVCCPRCNSVNNIYGNKT